MTQEETRTLKTKGCHWQDTVFYALALVVLVTLASAAMRDIVELICSIGHQELDLSSTLRNVNGKRKAS